jgi:hypothetical protein
VKKRQRRGEEEAKSEEGEEEAKGTRGVLGEDREEQKRKRSSLFTFSVTHLPVTPNDYLRNNSPHDPTLPPLFSRRVLHVIPTLFACL